jgi:AraC family transcriptional regulator of adaptative response/methylated-DNA-[protein]-cysteine methyltransferase
MREGYSAGMMGGEIEDSAAAAWRAVLARDRRADGRFVTGVLSTGIYCRPSCAARHPKRENVRFFASTAAAREAGLRLASAADPTTQPPMMWRWHA